MYLSEKARSRARVYQTYLWLYILIFNSLCYHMNKLLYLHFIKSLISRFLVHRYIGSYPVKFGQPTFFSYCLFHGCFTSHPRMSFITPPTSFSLSRRSIDVTWRHTLSPRYTQHQKSWSSSGRVVKLLACGERGPGFASRPRHLNFQRLVISCFKVEIWLKDR